MKLERHREREKRGRKIRRKKRRSGRKSSFDTDPITMMCSIWQDGCLCILNT